MSWSRTITDGLRTRGGVRRWAMLVAPLVVVIALGATVASSLRGQAEAAPPAASAAPGAEEAGRAPGVRVSLAEVFFIQRHPTTRKVEWLGSLIVWLLLAMSAASLGLIGAMLWDTRREAVVPPELLARARTLLSEGRAEDLRDFTRPDRSYFAEILHASLGELAHGRTAMVRAAEQTAEERAVHRLRRIEPLNIIGNVSPMIGLFGTVYGMILAFREIVAAGGTPDPVNLASGIGTALVTTFWGLIVAIPALGAYAVLRNRLDELTSHAWREAEECLNRLPDSSAGRAQKRTA